MRQFPGAFLTFLYQICIKAKSSIRSSSLNAILYRLAGIP